MESIIKALEKKWGPFEKDKYYLKQCDMSNGKKQSYLNVLFNPVDRKSYNFIEDMLDCKLLPQLEEFYKNYNGIMLFFESLRIYGVETGNKAIYDSCDMVQQNLNEGLQDLNEEFSNMIIFGYYSFCLFCYDKTKLDLIYVIDTTQEKIVYQFKTIKELLIHYVSYLIAEYDANGKKIHYNPEYEGLPMANLSLEFI
ncbi:MAG: hypothetical protein IJZ29_01785 [Clostridia bacterium]|nr:hypothetical protein [Clostridia bacterium]